MSKQTTRRFLFIMLVFLLFAGCAALPKITANTGNPIRTVALLPFVNNTNDVDGPLFVREQFNATIGQHFYMTKSLNDVDTILKDQLGITLGAQLDLAEPKKICKLLEVDGLFYGSLEDFSHTITGIYNTKRVRLRTKMVNCKTGETIWKNGIGVKQALRAGGGLIGNIPMLGQVVGVAGRIASVASYISDKNDTVLMAFLGDDIPAPWVALPEQESSIEGSLVIGVGEKVVGKMLNSPLKAETSVAINILLSGSYNEGGLFSSPVPHGSALTPGPVVSSN